MEMQRSWLIQRLKQPVNYSPIAFGGGCKNGGLSDKAFTLLKGIWSFDYMGSAEFEYGAVPESLGKLAEAVEKEQLICGSFKLHYKYEDWRTLEVSEGNKRVYYLCPKEIEKEVKTRIAKWAMSDRSDTKERIELNMSLSGNEKRSCSYGWLEIDNHFMFFTDEKMWRGSCDLFGVKTPSKKQVSKKK